MDYREFMEQANKLEAQAATLRKQAEEAKAKDAEKNTAKIKKARKGVVAATLNYLEAVDMAPDNDEGAKALEGLFDILFDELEKSIEQAKQSADILDRVHISDDEKLLNFLRKISE